MKMIRSATIMIFALLVFQGVRISAVAGEHKPADKSIPQSTDYDIHSYEAQYRLDCQNDPVMIEENHSYYTTLQGAYDAALDGYTILCQGVDLAEHVVFNDEGGKTVHLKGGYDCNYSQNPSGLTRINGSVTIAKGAAIFGGGSFAIGNRTTGKAGHITYSLWDSQVYRIKAEEGSTPENVSQALDTLSPLPSGGKDENLNISPDGKWLVLETERFDDECAGWSCLAVVAGDLSTGNVIRANGTVLHANGFPAIASGGNLVVYPDHGSHSMDLWAVTRSTGGAWGAPVELTTASSYAYNDWPAISQDGAKVVFNCTNKPYSGAGCICEVGVDGTGFRVVLTPADSPAGLPDTGDLNAPDYAPDGSIVFEADWDGEHIWRLPDGATEPVKITNNFNNDNSPCVLPDSSIASLWLNRPGGSGVHELKVMTADGSSYFMSVTGVDVADIGLGCGD